MSADQFPMILFCPECKDRRGATHARTYLIDGLKQGKVRVYGAMCGHFWDLSSDEMENLRKVLLPDATGSKVDL